MKELGSSNYSNLNKWCSMAINREQGTLTVVSPLLTTNKNTGVVSYLDALPYLRKEDQRVTYLN